MPLRTFTGPSGQTYTETTGSVFEVLADDDAEVIRLEASAFVLDRIIEVVEARGWTQKEAARALHTTQPRISMLMRGRLSQFSLGTLIEYAVRAGVRFGIVTPDESPSESWLDALDGPVTSARYSADTPRPTQAAASSDVGEWQISVSEMSVVAISDDALSGAANDYSYQLAG